MTATAKLFATVNIEWQDHKRHTYDCDVEVVYSYDGDGDIRILGTTTVGFCNAGEWEFDALVFDAIAEIADQEYAEWLAEQDSLTDEAGSELAA